MKRTKIKYIVLIAMIFVLSFCVLIMMFISQKTKQADNNFDTNTITDISPILMAVNNDFIVADGKKYTYVNGIQVNKPYIRLCEIFSVILLSMIVFDKVVAFGDGIL